MALIEQQDNEIRGRFYVKEDSEYLAQMVYVWAGTDKIIIEHTEVSEKLKGQGIGVKMLEELVKWARDKGIKIIPVCPFAKAMMDKKPEEYQDVLYHQ